jgi:hypothetical protein
MCKWLLIVALFGSRFARDAVADEYDPLKVEAIQSVRSIDLSVSDAARDRDVPIRVYLPPENAGEPKRTPQPVVLFSHGLGGSRADELVDHSIRVGDKDRTYHVHKDKAPTKPVPRVVYTPLTRSASRETTSARRSGTTDRSRSSV